MRKLFNNVNAILLLTLLVFFVATPCSAYDEDSRLVDIEEFIPSIFIDMRYATNSNFTKKVIYSSDRAYLRFGTAKKLKQVQEELLAKGYSLKVWDAFRPVEAQFELWKAYPDPNFVANPYKKYSKHSRGMAVDVTLVKSDGTEIEMPTDFDEFGSLADRDYSDLDATKAANALLLEKTMEKYGFKGYKAEWWHFEDIDGDKYGVIHNPDELIMKTTTTLAISAVGDCVVGADTRFNYMGSFFEEFEQQKGQYGYFFGGVKNILEKDDITIANLENVFTESNQTPDKSHQARPFFFKGSPKYANILKAGSVEAVNLANNHTFDYLEKGLADTKTALKNVGIQYFGYDDKAIVSVKGKKVGLLGYNTLGPLEKGVDIAALKQQIKNDIFELKGKTDLVIVSFHWGEEYEDVTPTQTELGRYTIDCGADLVFGHHPHIIQRIEDYNGKYIVYSLGNFVYGGNNNPDDKDTFIFQQIFEFKGDKIVKTNINIVPCLVSSVKYRNDYRPTVASGKDAERIFNKARIVYTRTQVTARVNGQALNRQIPYFIDKNGIVMVGLRAIGESLGAAISWNGSTQTATLTKGQKTLNFKIGQSQYKINGQPLKMDAPAIVVQNSTMVPLKAVSKGLGIDIVLDYSTRTVCTN